MHLLLILSMKLGKKTHHPYPYQLVIALSHERERSFPSILQSSKKLFIYIFLIKKDPPAGVTTQQCVGYNQTSFAFNLAMNIQTSYSRLMPILFLTMGLHW